MECENEYDFEYDIYSSDEENIIYPPISEPPISELLISEPLISEPLISEPLISEPLISEPLISEPPILPIKVSTSLNKDPVPTFPNERKRKHEREDEDESPLYSDRRTRMHKRQCFKKYEESLERAVAIAETYKKPSFRTVMSTYLDPSTDKELRELKNCVLSIHKNQRAASCFQEELIKKQETIIYDQKAIITELQKKEELNKCTFCNINRVDTLFYPCGHTNACYSCALKCTNIKKICPFCKTNVKEIVMFYK